MPANRQDSPNFFGNLGNLDLFTNTTGTPSYAQQVKTISETQSTPANPLNITVDDSGKAWAPTKSGVGAGTSTNSADSINSADNPTPTGVTTQIAVNASAASINRFISTQPNQLDQYASYTYGISWYVLTPSQYNAAIDTQKPNLAGWQLLMQSAGAPIAGRNPAFSLDYYMDDLEIETVVPFGGTNMAHAANKIRFKVTEPNGITLIQSLYEAVVGVYKKDQQAQTNANNKGETPNYIQAQYCLVIQFYGYDAQGNLVAPARGSSNGYGQQAVITKYYPFRIMDIKFQIANRAVEYNITGMAIPYSYNTSTDRGTIPFSFNMTGQTVEQLLNGSPIASGATANTNKADPKARKDTPSPTTVPPMPNEYNTPGWNNLDKYVQQRAQQSWFDTYGRRYNADGTANWGGG